MIIEPTMGDTVDQLATLAEAEAEAHKRLYKQRLRRDSLSSRSGGKGRAEGFSESMGSVWIIASLPYILFKRGPVFSIYRESQKGLRWVS